MQNFTDQIISLLIELQEAQDQVEMLQKAYIDLYFDYENLRTEHVKLFDKKMFGELDHQSKQDNEKATFSI